MSKKESNSMEDSSGTWAELSLKELVAYISKHFHEFSMEQIDHISERLCCHCDETPGECSKQGILESWELFAREYLSHMRKEEMLIFPLICALEEEENHDTTRILRDVLAQVVVEHRTIDRYLEQFGEKLECCNSCNADLADYWQVFVENHARHHQFEEEQLFVRLGKL
jgi:iron-sulfur cluster repair protein YtfE (RIC family)